MRNIHRSTATSPETFELVPAGARLLVSHSPRLAGRCSQSKMQLSAAAARAPSFVCGLKQCLQRQQCAFCHCCHAMVSRWQANDDEQLTLLTLILAHMMMMMICCATCYKVLQGSHHLPYCPIGAVVAHAVKHTAAGCRHS